MVFDTTSIGVSTIAVDYVLDGSTLGVSTDNTKDFYVLQSLQGGADGTDCSTAYLPTFTGLNALTEPAITGAAQTTTTLVNTADWPRGANKFCLRMKLMLQMSNNIDQLWHQVDFQVTVTVSFENGAASVTYDGTAVAEDMTFETAGSGTGVGTDIGVAPEFTTTVVGGTSFAYGEDIPIAVAFVHPLNVFTYTVDVAGIIPVTDTAGTPLQIDGSNVAMRTKTFTPNFAFTTAGGTIGTVTVTLPLSVYQDTTISSVKVKIPVTWVNNVRRNLRMLQSDSEVGTYTGPSSGVGSGIVEIELEPYTDESGAIVGFTITSVVSSVCLGATAFLL